jgi:hypothetical protein
MEVIIPILLLSIFWGSSIGQRNGLRFWLYGTSEGFSASLLVALGFFISLGGGWATVIGLGLLIFAAIALYEITKNQFYNGSTFEMWVLYFGKISFSIMTAGLLFLIAMLIGVKNK